jgi:hypothetical protein
MVILRALPSGVAVATVVSHVFPPCVTLTVFFENLAGTPTMMILSTRISFIDLRYDDVAFPLVPKFVETRDFPANVNLRWMYAPEV